MVTAIQLVALCCFTFCDVISAVQLPLVVSTWPMTVNATRVAYAVLTTGSGDRLDALEYGINVCDVDKDCGPGIGYNDKPNAVGEVTLDAMLMDGEDMTLGAVGCLRWVKNAVGVARAIIKYTVTTFLVGSDASNFAEQMGFTKENISEGNAITDHETWKNSNCQPNKYRQGAVTPDPTTTCGPYSPVTSRAANRTPRHSRPLPENKEIDRLDHDTIGMVLVDAQGKVASGVSTNGLRNKIPGRVGDSPIPGAGSYAEKGIGAAAATGDGDLMMRMLPSFHAVALMREGYSPKMAADLAMSRLYEAFPEVVGALITISVTGEYGASCTPEYGTFGYTVQGGGMDDVEVEDVLCITGVIKPTPRPTTPACTDGSPPSTTPTAVLLVLALIMCYMQGSN